MEIELRRIVKEFQQRSRIYDEKILDSNFFEQSDLNKLRANKLKLRVGLEYRKNCENDQKYIDLILENNLFQLEYLEKLDMEKEIIELVKNRLEIKNMKFIIGLISFVISFLFFLIIGLTFTASLAISIGFLVLGVILGQLHFNMKKKNQKYCVSQIYYEIFSSIAIVVKSKLSEKKFDLNSYRLILNQALNYSRKLLKLSKFDKYCQKLNGFQHIFLDLIFSEKSIKCLHLTWKILMEIQEYEESESSRIVDNTSMSKQNGSFQRYLKKQFEEIFIPFIIFSKFNEKNSREVRQLLLEISEFKSEIMKNIPNFRSKIKHGENLKRMKSELIKLMTEEDYPFCEEKLLLKKNGNVQKESIPKIEMIAMLPRFFEFKGEKAFSLSIKKIFEKEGKVSLMSSRLNISLDHSFNINHDIRSLEHPNIFYPKSIITKEFKSFISKSNSLKKNNFISTEGGNEASEAYELPERLNTGDDFCVGVDEKISVKPKMKLKEKKDSAAGGIAAGISKSLTAPVERVKMLLQTQDAHPRMINSGEKYKGIKHCIKTVRKKEGIPSFWRGNFTNVIRYFPTQALNFAFNEKYKVFFTPKSQEKKSLKINLIAGGTAGITTTMITYPLDFARTRLTADIGKINRQFEGLNDVIRKIYKKEGFRGIYRGIGISGLGIFQYRGLYFGVYSSLKDYSKGNIFLKFLIAKFGTSLSGFVSYPFDTIRRRLMMQSGKNQDRVQYRNGWDCFNKILKKEGYKGFFKGALSNFFRGIGASLVLVVYDEMQTLVEKYK